MTDTTKDIWNEDDREAGGKRPKGRGLRHFLLFFVILVAVFGVVVLAAYRDGTGFDALRRYFSYGTTEKSKGNGTFTYDASASNRFALLGDGLVVLSDTELQVLDGSGQQVYRQAVSMSAPALSTGGGCAVAYDVGGTELYLVNRSGELLHLSVDASAPLIAATLNQEGWLAVTAEKKGYKGCVSVYNDKQTLVFEFNSSARFVTDARVSDNCKYLTAVTLGQENSVFVSNLVVYDLSEKDPKTNYDVADGLVLTIGELGGRTTAVSDTCVTFAAQTGEIAASYDYGDDYLRECSLSGEGYVALLLNRYQSGSVGRLVTVNTDGEEIAALNVSEEVLSVSAAGRYIAVQYAGRLVIYNEELQEYAALSGADYAKEALMRPDGSAVLIASEKATLFLP